jgi:DHA1 family bicyclomycin/chloramphenicol resistance-like MFS transporter
MGTGRSMSVDLASGARLVRVLNVIADLGGVAAIAGPLLGALILQLSGGRMSFWVVAAVLGRWCRRAGCGALVTAARAPPRRRPAGLRCGRSAVRRPPAVRRLSAGHRFGDGRAVRVRGDVNVCLQSVNGYRRSRILFDFAANVGQMAGAALFAARLAGRVGTPRVILVGQSAARSVPASRCWPGRSGSARRCCWRSAASWC